jgi:hypothetical protein
VLWQSLEEWAKSRADPLKNVAAKEQRIIDLEQSSSMSMSGCCQEEEARERACRGEAQGQGGYRAVQYCIHW